MIVARFSLVCASLLMVGSVAVAQSGLSESTVEAIDQVVEGVMTKGGSPGVAVAVVIDGEFRWAKGYGVEGVESKVPVTPETVFRYASISKMITAAGAMQLVESGELDLAAEARSLCPELSAQHDGITVHHLLSHQAGIRHWDKTSERNNQTGYENVSDTLAMLADSELLFAPGTAEEYSTPAYNIVGCVMESASGLSYAEYMQSRVFDVTGMTSARVGDAPGQASGYRRGPLGPRDARMDDLSIKYPGGGLAGSVQDLGRFAEALLQGKLVKPETLEAMWTAKTLADGTVTNKGYGCNLGSEKGRDVVWHIGGVAGFCGNLYFVPEQKAAVAVLFNLEAQDVFPTSSAIMDAVLAK